jgi:hypothetical protein
MMGECVHLPGESFSQVLQGGEGRSCNFLRFVLEVKARRVSEERFLVLGVGFEVEVFSGRIPVGESEERGTFPATLLRKGKEQRSIS